MPQSGTKYVRLEGSPRDEDHNVYIAIVDLTTRHAAETALANEHRLLVRAEALCHLGSWRYLLETHEFTCSDEMRRMMDLDADLCEESLLEKMRQRVDGQDVGRMGTAHTGAFENGHMAPVEFRIVGPDSDVRWFHLQGEPECDEQGQTVALAGFLLDITDRVEAETRRFDFVEQLADTDALTGLLNRRGFALLSQQMSLHAARSGEGVALLFIDVDDLKTINDQYGHAVGDRMLRDVADMLRRELRTSDIIARFGGDEFIVMAAGNEEAAKTRVRSQVESALAGLNAEQGRAFPVSLSIGTASRGPKTAERSLSVLIEEADRSMYAHKHHRREEQPPGSQA